MHNNFKSENIVSRNDFTLKYIKGLIFFHLIILRDQIDNPLNKFLRGQTWRQI